mmetsp:Transcript_33156/g.109592  ORF Transcript_33156/g.109592 Transcript_33156/m.109592 type:complete len:365 (-) Transcript_33156:144-1238(-)
MYRGRLRAGRGPAARSVAARLHRLLVRRLCLELDLLRDRRLPVRLHDVRGRRTERVLRHGPPQRCSHDHAQASDPPARESTPCRRDQPHLEARPPRLVRHVRRRRLPVGGDAGGCVSAHGVRDDHLLAAPARLRALLRPPLPLVHAARHAANDVRRRRHHLHGHLLVWLHALLLGTAERHRADGARGAAPRDCASTPAGLRAARRAGAVPQRPLDGRGARAVVDDARHRLRRRRGLFCRQAVRAHAAHLRLAGEDVGGAVGRRRRGDGDHGGGGRPFGLALPARDRRPVRHRLRADGIGRRPDRLAAQALRARQRHGQHHARPRGAPRPAGLVPARRGASLLLRLRAPHAPVRASAEYGHNTEP